MSDIISNFSSNLKPGSSVALMDVELISAIGCAVRELFVELFPSFFRVFYDLASKFDANDCLVPVSLSGLTVWYGPLGTMSKHYLYCTLCSLLLLFGITFCV